MLNEDFIQNYKVAINHIDDVVIEKEKSEAEGRGYTFVVKHDNGNYLIKIQEENDEYSSTKHIFSVHFIVRMSNIPKNKKELHILKAFNDFNEKYGMVKGIYHKTKNGDAFWFRSEMLSNECISTDIITNMISVLKSSPKLLSGLIKAQ